MTTGEQGRLYNAHAAPVAKLSQKEWKREFQLRTLKLFLKHTL